MKSQKRNKTVRDFVGDYEHFEVVDDDYATQSILSNYLYEITDEDITALKSGGVLHAYGDESGILILYNKGGNK